MGTAAAEGESTVVVDLVLTGQDPATIQGNKGSCTVGSLPGGLQSVGFDFGAGDYPSLGDGGYFSIEGVYQDSNTSRPADIYKTVVNGHSLMNTNAPGTGVTTSNNGLHVALDADLGVTDHFGQRIKTGHVTGTMDCVVSAAASDPGRSSAQLPFQALNNGSGNGGGSGLGLTTTMTPRQSASLAAAARGSRSVVAASLATPAEAAKGGGRLATNVVLAGLLVLLLVFPSELFNSTFSKHHERIEVVLRRILPWRRAAPAAPSPKGASALVYLGVIVAAAIIGGFLDPKFGLHMASLALVLGVLAAGLTGATLAWGVNRLYRGVRHAPTEAMIKVIPLGLAVAIVCVVISRSVQFQPGYLYGAVGGVGFVTALERSDGGRSTFVAIVAGMAIAIGAWFAFVPVSALANHLHPGLPILIVDSVLASLFIGGIEGALLGLIPLEVLPGHEVSRWSWIGWGIAAFTAAFLFVDVLLRPQSGYLGKSTTSSTLVTYGLFAAFAVVSVAFWGWFRLRPDPPIVAIERFSPSPSGR
jgi:hypothetical protein